MLSYIYNRLLHTHLFVLLGADHQLRTHVLVKILLAESLELHGARLQGDALLVGILCNLGRHVVSDDRVQACNKHQTVTWISQIS
jgi:hypothetical protein